MTPLLSWKFSIIIFPVYSLHSFVSPYLNHHISNSTTRGSFSFRGILPTEIMLVISAHVGCALGPDGFKAKFIKLASQVLIFPLADLFNLSLSACELPSIWKYAKVTPLHKGDPLDLNNWRLISIICTTAKIFVNLIFNQLSQYINDLNISSSFQYGFCATYSTTSALVKFTNDVFSSLEYFWKGCTTRSILGPLFFSIFINYLPKNCSNCVVQLFADDTVVYTSDSDITKIQSSLQSEFSFVLKWVLNNNLILNKQRSCSMLFGTSYNLNHTPVGELAINFTDGCPLIKDDKFKYLGLWIDS